jgi:hypothetical protein
MRNANPKTDRSESKDKNQDNPNNRYTLFLEQRIQECLEENKRYLAKYSDLRIFAYQQIEWLIRKNQGKQVMNKNSLNIYKQLIDKERKQWNEERARKE